MAIVRGIRVDKDAGLWEWFHGGHVWSFRIVPARGLWRDGLDVFPRHGPFQPLCVDDAVLFSIGYEAATVAYSGGPPPHGEGGGDAA